MSQILSILLELVKLLIKTHLKLSIISNLLGNLRVHEVGENSLNLIGTLIQRSEATMSFKLFIIVIHQVYFHVLNVLSSKAILSVQELDDLFLRCANSAIILDHDIFESFDKSPLNISSLSSLDSGINQTLTTSHGVEEKLLRCETSKVAILDEALASGTEIILAEVR